MAGAQKISNAAEIDRLALMLAREPGSKAFIPLAEEYGKAGMWQEAAVVLEDGLRAYPNFIIAMVALGRTYEQLNQPVKAKAILEEAVKLSPENLRAHRTLARIYVAEGAKEAAVRSCRVILAVNPNDEEALSLQAALQAAHAGSSVQAAAPVAVERPHAGAAAVPVCDPSASGPSVASEARRTTITRLERWLNMIQRRRQDRQNEPSAA